MELSCLGPAGLYCLGPAGLCPPYLSLFIIYLSKRWLLLPVLAACRWYHVWRPIRSASLTLLHLKWCHTCWCCCRCCHNVSIVTARYWYLHFAFLRAVVIKQESPADARVTRDITVIPRWPSAAILDIIEPEIAPFDPPNPKTLA